MLKVKTCNNLQGASYNMQRATCNCIVAVIKVARKWPAPNWPLMPVGRSVQRSNRPPGSCALAPSIVRQAFVRRSFRSFAGGVTVPPTITGLRIFIIWTVRSDWVQVVSCNIMLMRAARPTVQVLQDFLQVVIVLASYNC